MARKKTTEENLQQEAQVIEQPKKKRGRPRKNPEPVVAETVVKEEATTKIETKNEDLEKITDGGSLYNDSQTQLVLEGLASISKEVKSSVVTMNKNEIRIIIDSYYQTQELRKTLTAQIRNVNNGQDEILPDNYKAIEWLAKDLQNRENQIKKLIDEFCKSVPVCRWALQIKGIGPVFAANLYRYIDLSKCHYATQFLSYAGFNDNNAPWLGKEKATKLVDSVFEKNNLKNNAKVDDYILLQVAVQSGRNLRVVKQAFNKHRECAAKSDSDRTVLIKVMSKPPYNKDLKSLCYLIGESFCKNQNRGSLYGEIFKERKALETLRNENGEFADQAAKLLKEKNYSKDTDTYKYLIQGKLSPGHIVARARRYATKIFLTHFFEATHISERGTTPPSLYVIEHMGHKDYIAPEVPFEDFFGEEWKNKR